MAVKNYLYDTNIIIYFLKDDPFVTRFFNQSFLKKNNIFISSITRIELLSFPSIDKEELSKINDLLNIFSISHLTSDIEDKVIEIRKSKKIKIPDAIIAATALKLNAILLTRNIEDYKNLSDLNILNPFA